MDERELIERLERVERRLAELEGREVPAAAAQARHEELIAKLQELLQVISELAGREAKREAQAAQTAQWINSHRQELDETASHNPPLAPPTPSSAHPIQASDGGPQ